MLDFLNITKALSDENRVRTLMMLRNGELCVCQLIEMLGLAPSTVSKHLSILRQARLVLARKEGRWMYYRLADGDAPEHVLQAVRWAQECLANDKQIVTDSQQLKAVCKIDKEELCACYEKTKLNSTASAAQNRR